MLVSLSKINPKITQADSNANRHKPITHSKMLASHFKRKQEETDRQIAHQNMFFR